MAMFTTYFLSEGSNVTGNYLREMWKLRDRRLDGYPMMDSPWPTMVISALYLVTCALGPIVMKDRKPFNLKSSILVYNAFQVANKSAS